MTQEQPAPDRKRIVLAADLESVKGIKLSNSRRWQLEKEGRFPRRIRVGHSTVYYLESELDAWIDEQVAKRAVPAEVERAAA